MASTNQTTNRKNMVLPQAVRRINKICRVGLTTATTSSSSLLSSRPNKKVDVLDSFMSYVDVAGDDKLPTAVFVHGNPSNSFLWRDPIKVVHSRTGMRCVAPDLIGQGMSGVSSTGYRYQDQYNYLNQWFQEMNFDSVVLVIHDWGSALSFRWARENPEKVKALIHMESVPGPLDSWESFPAVGRKVFQNMRKDGIGEKMVLEKNFFVERLLLADPITKELSEEEKTVYRERFSTPESRLPTLQWPREIPIRGDGPADVIEITQRNFDFHRKDERIPKLFIDAEPGFFSSYIKEKTKDWKNHKVVGPVKGLHFIQEDSGKQIGDYVCDFLKESKVIP